MSQHANEGEDAHEGQNGAEQTQKRDIMEVLDEKALLDILGCEHNDRGEDHVEEEGGLHFNRLICRLGISRRPYEFHKPSERNPKQDRQRGLVNTAALGFKRPFT